MLEGVHIVSFSFLALRYQRNANGAMEIADFRLKSFRPNQPVSAPQESSNRWKFRRIGFFRKGSRTGRPLMGWRLREIPAFHRRFKSAFLRRSISGVARASFRNEKGAPCVRKRDLLIFRRLDQRERGFADAKQ